MGDLTVHSEDASPGARCLVQHPTHSVPCCRRRGHHGHHLAHRQEASRTGPGYVDVEYSW